jgi:hypothetical protein
VRTPDARPSFRVRQARPTVEGQVIATIETDFGAGGSARPRRFFSKTVDRGVFFF